MFNRIPAPRWCKKTFSSTAVPSLPRLLSPTLTGGLARKLYHRTNPWVQRTRWLGRVFFWFIPNCRAFCDPQKAGRQGTRPKPSSSSLNYIQLYTDEWLNVCGFLLVYIIFFFFLYCQLDFGWKLSSSSTVLMCCLICIIVFSVVFAWMCVCVCTTHYI